MNQKAAMVEYIVSALVKNPQAVKIDTVVGSQEVVIELRVAEEDMGKVIGKNGSVIRSLRTLLAAARKSDEPQYILEIVN